MAKAIVSKPATTPATTQKSIPSELIGRAMENGLSLAHESLLYLLDIGDNYTKLPLANKTLRTTMLQHSNDAAQACANAFDESANGIPSGIADDARKEALQASMTMERLHEFFWKDDGANVSALQRETVGNTIVGMVKSAGVHLERAIDLLGVGGYHKFEFPGDEHTAVKKANGYRAAAEAITEAHGALFALKDLGEQLDLWQFSFITLGQTLMPLTVKLDEQLAKVEGLLPSPRTAPAETATVQILKAMEYTEALAFMAKHLIYGEGSNYDDPKSFENEETTAPDFWSDFTRDRLLSCFGSAIVGMVHQIAHHTDCAIEALGEKHLVISLH